ncbi:hypothetical protein QR98_0039260 [Sarcoptes scabiei]|uniref:Uncharacterized protein n=1 Tax=Sarcoptes scabiei TaxID=52283 RepID=A0A132A386_SARSC|nr:hypothetical protein QR98_0039260 [Sarcoptes scabiei]
MTNFVDCLDLAKQNEDYECELQKLDFLHEQERSKLLALRSELLHENQQLRQQLSDEKLKEAKDFGCQTLGPNYEQIFKIANIHWDPSDPNVSVDDITAKLCEKITFLSRNNMTLLNAQQHPLEMPSHYDPINDQSTCLGNEKIENDNQNVPIDDHLDKLSLREEPEGSFSDQQIVESVDEPSNNERLVDGERNTFATLNELKLLKEDLDKKEMECIDFRKRLIENKTEIESKESRLIEMKHQYEILQDQFNVIESQLNTQLNENQKDRIDLKKFKTQCEKLTIDVENSANDFKKLTIVLAAKESELSEMRKRLESIDLTEKSSEKDSLIQIKQDQIEQLTSELDRLRKHLVETEEIYSSYLKESQNNIETYEVRLREQEAINSTLVQKDLERENSFFLCLLRKLHEKLEECSNRKHLLEDENEQLKANLIDYQSVIEQLEKG